MALTLMLCWAALCRLLGRMRVARLVPRCRSMPCACREARTRFPITRILPWPLAVMPGTTARTSLGSGSTSAAKVCCHSASVTSTASVFGAGKREICDENVDLSRRSNEALCCAHLCQGARLPQRLRRGRLRERLPDNSIGPMNSPACVTRIRLP